MKGIIYIILGIIFGISLSKAEVISWYRIYEMFRFDSFHMYGVIGSAVTLGIIGTYLMKKLKLKNINGELIQFVDKDFSIVRYLVGGIFFGLGWALVGACPGPMFILIGHGYWSIFIVIAGALLGTLLYGILRPRLKH